MRTQTIEVRKSESIFIETPGGIIEIRRGTGRMRHKVFIDLPNGFVAHRDRDRMVDDAKFVDLNPDGTVSAKYQVLTPVEDEDGHLIGVDTPRLMHVG